MGSKSIEGKARDDIRDKLKQLDIPKEMGLIVRTAGEGVSLEELKWDLELGPKNNRNTYTYREIYATLHSILGAYGSFQKAST